MGVDFENLLLGPVYDVHGIEAELDLGTSGMFTLTVLNRTEAATLDAGSGLAYGMQFGTAKPLAIVRVSELTKNGLSRGQLEGGAISFNGGSWTILSTAPKPIANGSGEVILTLEQA